MKSGRFLAAALGLTCAPAASQVDVSRVRFNGPFQPLQFAADQVTVHNDAGEPWFKAGGDHVLKVAGVATPFAYEWKIKSGLVRISPSGRPGVWLSCGDLKPASIVCTLQPEVDGGILTFSSAGAPGGEEGARGPGSDPQLPAALPVCPGDPRCPKL